MRIKDLELTYLYLVDFPQIFEDKKCSNWDVNGNSIFEVWRRGFHWAYQIPEGQFFS